MYSCIDKKKKDVAMGFNTHADLHCMQLIRVLINFKFYHVTALSRSYKRKLEF